MAASESKTTSTRDPNLISPTRWPRATVLRLEVEYDAARDQAGDLLEDHGAAFAFDGDDVLLVFLSRIGPSR